MMLSIFSLCLFILLACLCFEQGKRWQIRKRIRNFALTPFAPTLLERMRLFAYSWKLPAYSGAFSRTVDNFSFFAYNFSFFTYSWSFFAYSGKVHLIWALRDCKQRSSTVSKKAPTVSKKASPCWKPPTCHHSFFQQASGPWPDNAK